MAASNKGHFSLFFCSLCDEKRTKVLFGLIECPFCHLSMDSIDHSSCSADDNNDDSGSDLDKVGDEVRTPIPSLLARNRHHRINVPIDNRDQKQ
jgi:hypothetical protein